MRLSTKIILIGKLLLQSARTDARTESFFVILLYIYLPLRNFLKNRTFSLSRQAFLFLSTVFTEFRRRLLKRHRYLFLFLTVKKIT